MACPEKTLIKYTPDIHARERGLFQRQGHVYVSCKCVCVWGGGGGGGGGGVQERAWESANTFFSLMQ